MKPLLYTLTVGLCLSLTAWPQRSRMAMPPSLKQGDHIAVISPSSQPSRASVMAGCDTLRQWGYVPVVGPHAFDNYYGFAGTADQRADDLRWALRDSTIKAIFCTRGGDGAVQLLTRIPLNEFRRQPKWLVGFSDVTALHSAMVSAGVMSIHGPVCTTLPRKTASADSVNATLRKMLQGQWPAYNVKPQPYNLPGKARGMLVGGNMSVFCGLAGANVDFLSRATSGEGLILFIEDTHEAITKVDRMLHLLEVRGILKQLRGIIVGNFSNYNRPKKPNDRGFSSMEEMLHEYLSHYNMPVAFGFPVGHQRANYPLVEGAQVELTVDAQGSQLKFLGPVL